MAFPLILDKVSVESGRQRHQIGLSMESPVVEPLKTIESFNRQFALNEDERKAVEWAWPQEAGDMVRIQFLGLDRPALPFWVIGSDQGLAASATEVTELLFEPGGRWDIIVDFDGHNGERMVWRTSDGMHLLVEIMDVIIQMLNCLTIAKPTSLWRLML